MGHNPRYRRSLTRNLHELIRTLSYRNAVNALWEVAPTTDWSFFTYASLAFHGEMFSHAIKVLDKHKDVASFYYIYRSNPKAVLAELKKCNLTLSDVDQLTAKLKIVRDKTHFHIDRDAVFAPNATWEQANITGTFFNHVVDRLWTVLNSLYSLEFDHDFGQPVYLGQDIKEIISTLKSHGIQI